MLKHLGEVNMLLETFTNEWFSFFVRFSTSNNWRFFAYKYCVVLSGRAARQSLVGS